MLQEADASMKAGGRKQAGLSVDAISVYINRLPDVPGLERVHAAVVGWEPHNESIVTWFVTPQDLADNWEKTHVPPWLRGCNTVGRPNPQVLEELGKVNLLHIYRSQHVPALSVRELLAAHQGCRTRLLKIDTEGFDTILLVGYSNFLWAHPECFADKIQFETMWSSEAMIKGAQDLLAQAGYSYCGLEEDQGGGAPDSVLCYSATKDTRLQGGIRARASMGHSEEEILALLSGNPERVQETLSQGLEKLVHAAQMRPCGTCPWS
jgi:hypothetical protein